MKTNKYYKIELNYKHLIYFLSLLVLIVFYSNYSTIEKQQKHLDVKLSNQAKGLNRLGNDIHDMERIIQELEEDNQENKNEIEDLKQEIENNQNRTWTITTYEN